MPMKHKPCGFERNFQDIPKDKITEAEQTALLIELGWKKGFSWDELLKSRRILIISEAGAGKTYECRKTQGDLFRRGEFAFYVELIDLSNNKLIDLFSKQEERRFNIWLESQSKIAFFFLDSIDELGLSLGSFEQALKRLAKAIDGRLDRACIIITSRPIPVDEQLFRQILPIPEVVEEATESAFADIAMARSAKEAPEKNTGHDWRNVALLPLSTEQIRQMAIQEGVSDPDALLADIERRNAADFVRRPQDLIELCADWRAHRRIRSHRDQVASNIAVKLKPREDRREKASLSADKAMQGACRLALAATLSRKLTLRHSAEADRGGDPANVPLDPALILRDWTREERTTLLERPLFGMASYGRVRFHHRSVIEYLAAQHLLALRSGGMSAKSIKRLLFTTAQGNTVVKPSLRPVTAWMALQSDAILTEALMHEPDVLLNHGDPESLPANRRQQALRAYVERHRAGNWRGLRVPDIQLHRFASPDLGPEVERLWAEGVENPEVRSILLELAGLGKMTECADFCHEVAIDSASAYVERIHGLDALIQFDDPRLETISSSLARDMSRWPDRLTRTALLRLFPSHLSVNQLCETLGRFADDEGSASDLSWGLPRLIDHADLPIHILDDLRLRLDDLSLEGIAWNTKHWPYLVSNRQFLLPALAATCLRLLQHGIATPKVMWSAAIVLRLSERSYERSDPIKMLAAVCSEASNDTRRLVFEAQDALFERYCPEPDAFNRYARLAFYDTPIPLGPADRKWIIASLGERDRPADYRAMLLEAAINCPDGNMSLLENVAALKPHIADLTALVDRLDDHARPRIPAPKIEHWPAQQIQQREHDRRRDAKAHTSWVTFRREIKAYPDRVFAPDRADNTAWALYQVMERSPKEGHASGWNRPFIERHFGKDIADRLRIALMAYWRKERPTLRSERTEGEKDTFYVHWRAGLAGVAAEAEDPAWAKSLTFDDAKSALRYVPLELNGLPPWLEGLAAAHPKAVDIVLGSELTAELAEPAPRRSFTLQSIRHAPSVVASLFVPRLRNWLDEGDWRRNTNDAEGAPANRLSQVLQILIQHGDAETAKHMLALARTILSDGATDDVSGPWLSVLLRLSPAEGVDALEKILQLHPPSKFGPATEWFSTLFNHRRSRDDTHVSASTFAPNLLVKLARLAFQYICPADDMEHGPGGFKPNIRDHAEQGRSNILNALFATTGPEGWSAKIQFAQDPLSADYRDWAIAVARERAAEDADAVAYSEAEILAFDRHGELPPLTRADMFRLLTDRLDDLDDLLLRDDSPRAAWALIEDETVMRQQIALELRRDANGAYVVDQEAVTADQKETDIRLRSIGSEQEAVIELKIGEKDRSAADLKATLRDQIVAKYLAPESRRCGCLLVTVKEPRRWRHPETGASMDLKELVVMLNEESAKIEKEMGGSLRLMARGLDLQPRLQTEKAQTRKRKT